MAVLRQLKLADSPCEWCGAPVVAQHRDKECCSDRCGAALRLFRFLSMPERQQAACEGSVTVVALWRRLETLSAAIDAESRRLAA